MVHSYLARIFSLRPSESQMVTARQISTLNHPISKMETNPLSDPEDSIPTSINNNNNNNNDKGDSACQSEAVEHAQPTRWSATNSTWTWTPNNGTDDNKSDDDYEASSSGRLTSNKRILCLLAVVILVILVISILLALFIVLVPRTQALNASFPYTPSTIPPPPTLPPILPDSFRSPARTIKNRDELKKASKMSWDLLNRSDKKKPLFPSSPPHQDNNNNGISGGDDEDEVVLPAQMVYTSGSDGRDAQSLGKDGKSPRSCCRIQKYTQVIEREGCDPVTIVNRMCIGQCVSVWVPGLFASFPVCRPSRSNWKTVTMTCGRKRDRRKRVRVERVRRCSCMEVEPTVPAVIPSSSL